MPFRDGAASPTERRSTSPRRQAPTDARHPPAAPAPAAAAVLPSDPTLAAILAAVHAGSATLSEKLDNSNAKLDQMGGTLKAHGAQLQEHTDHLTQQQSELKDMAERLSMLEGRPTNGLTRAVSAPEFRRGDATPTKADFKDLAKVQISGNEYFPRDALIGILEKLLSEANLAMDLYEVTPKANCSKSYTLKFKGENATIKAKQFLQSMRLEGGEWKREFAMRPDGSKEQLYFNADKSINEKAKERKLKIIFNLLKTALPQATFTKKTKDGTIIIGGWTTAATLQHKEDKIKWGTAVEITATIKESIEKLYNERISSFRP